MPDESLRFGIEFRASAQHAPRVREQLLLEFAPGARLGGSQQVVDGVDEALALVSRLAAQPRVERFVEEYGGRIEGILVNGSCWNTDIAED